MRLDWIGEFLNFMEKISYSHTIAIPLNLQLFHAGWWDIHGTGIPTRSLPGPGISPGSDNNGKNQKMFRIRGIYRDLTNILTCFLKPPGLPGSCSVRLFFRDFDSGFISKTSYPKDQGIIPASRLAWTELKMRWGYHIASYGLLRRMMKCEKKKMQLDLDVK